MPHSASIPRRRLLDRPAAALGLASVLSAALHVLLLAALYGPRQPLRPAAYPAITVALAPSVPRVRAGQVEPTTITPTTGEHPLSPRPVILAPPAPAAGPARSSEPPTASPTPGEHALLARSMTASPSPAPRTSSVRSPQNRVRGEPPAAPPGPAYYPARDLDVYPALLAPVDAQGAGGRTGSVRLEVRIDDRGRVVHVAVLEADAVPEVAAQARHALAGARFSPGLRDGRAVHSRLLIELTYGYGPRAVPSSAGGDTGSVTPEPAQ